MDNENVCNMTRKNQYLAIIHQRQGDDRGMYINCFSIFTQVFCVFWD